MPGMPISCTVSQEKRKSKSQLLCDAIDRAIENTQEQIVAFEKIKEEFAFEPGLLKQAVEKGLAPPEDIKQLLTDQQEWKTEVKSDVKSAVTAEKKRMRDARSKLRENLKNVIEKKVTLRRRRSKSKLI